MGNKQAFSLLAGHFSKKKEKMLRRAFLTTLKPESRILARSYSEGQQGQQQRKERGINSVTLMGRVGKEPVPIGNQGTAVTFPLYTNENFKNRREPSCQRLKCTQ